MKKLWGHYKSEEGVVAVIVTFLLVILLSFSAMAVDSGFYYYQKSKLQTACDAAALAACYKLPNTTLATATAKEYMVKNGFTEQDVVVTFLDSNKSVKVVSTRVMETYFANVFNVNSLDYACKATATSKTQPLTGVAFGFDIYSGNRYPTQPSFSVATQNKCVLSGLTNRVYGNVHSNYNVDANTSTIVGVGEAVGTVTGVNILTKVPGVAFIPMPDFSMYKAQIKTEAQAAGQYYSGNFSIANKTSVNLTAPLYVEGNANLSGISFSGKGTIYAGGKITVTGTATNYDAISKICMYSGYTSTNKSDAAIDFAGSSKNITGMLYAPNGSILVSGSNYTFTGCIIGRVVDVSGSGKNFYNADISDSFKYATTTAVTLIE